MNSDIYVLVENIRGEISDITYVMLAAANELAQAVNGKVVAVLLGYEVEPLAQYLAADKVLLISQPHLQSYSPDAYLQVLSTLIKDTPPRVFIFGHTSLGMDLFCGLGVKLGIPVTSQCLRLSSDGTDINFVSQICGGKIMAEGRLPDPVALVSMVPGAYKPEHGKRATLPEIESLTLPVPEETKVKLVSFVEPDITDVDITKEKILIAIGRGLQNENDLELVEELAETLGGKVCASRPIIDKGWLPIPRLVGKSGKRVAPQLYLALGISGAPEHVEGMLDSELIVSINTDPTAPIFDVAQYGAEIDLIDLLTALSEQLKLPA